MIGAHRLFGREFAVRDQPQHFDEGQLMLGVVDLAAKQRDPGAVFLRLVDQLEGVVSRPGAAAEDADHQVRVVLGQLLHRARAVINNLQKERSPRLGHAGQAAEDVVIDEFAELLRRDAAGDVRVEHFQEITELLPFRLFAKFLERQQRLPVRLQLVDERHRIKAEIGAREFSACAVALDLAALDLVDAGRAKRLRRLFGVAAVPHRPDIGRVVRARGSLIVSCSLT